jgi:hypothetical protein
VARTARLGLLIAACALAAAGAGVVARARPVDAQACGGTTQSDDSGTNVEVGCNDHQEGGPGGQTGGSGPGSGHAGGGAADVCGYVRHPDQSLLHRYFPDAPDGAVLLYFICPREGVYSSEDTRLGLPDIANGQAFLTIVVPTPEQVAIDIWARVRARLLDPSLVTSPATGRTAVVSVPTFVEVENWQGEISERDCVLGVCVTLTATPTLTFDPGEPGSSTVECAPPGTRYDPDGPPAAAQATVPGACAHAYRHRTGVHSRPDAWPGVVTVEWAVSWESGGASGSFDPVVLSADLPRRVDEITALVTEMRAGGR